MFTWLLWLMLACAILDWMAVWRGWRLVNWGAKPATLILLLAWFSMVGRWQGALPLVGMGLIFSLLGDILLEMRAGFFIFGMLAFLTAHCWYITFFSQLPLKPVWILLIPLIFIIAYCYLLLRKVLTGLREHHEMGLAIPLIGYSLILGAMWFFAVTTLFRPQWTVEAAVLCTAGASFFLISDSILAYNRFVRPLPAGDLLVMVTYHVAQIMIATGALMQAATV
jgi:uncharacterized membrane protein YhhN